MHFRSAFGLVALVLFVACARPNCPEHSLADGSSGGVVVERSVSPWLFKEDLSWFDALGARMDGPLVLTVWGMTPYDLVIAAPLEDAPRRVVALSRSAPTIGSFYEYSLRRQLLDRPLLFKLRERPECLQHFNLSAPKSRAPYCDTDADCPLVSDECGRGGCRVPTIGKDAGVVRCIEHLCTVRWNCATMAQWRDHYAFCWSDNPGRFQGMCQTLSAQCGLTPPTLANQTLGTT